MNLKIKKYSKIIFINLKIILFPRFVLALFFLSLTPLMFGIKNTDSSSAALICEQYISILGIILLSSLFSPEQQGNISEIVNCKIVPHLKIYLLRILISIIELFLLITVFVLSVKASNVNISVTKFILATFYNSLFLGFLGLLINLITANTLLGVMIPLTLSLYQFVNRNNLVGFKLNLYSLYRDSFTEKYYLLFGTFVIFFITVLIYKVKQHLK